MSAPQHPSPGCPCDVCALVRRTLATFGPATTKTTPEAAAIVSAHKLPRGVYGISHEGTGVVHNHGSAFDAVAAALARGMDHRLYRMADGWRFVGIVHADGRFTDERAS